MLLDTLGLAAAVEWHVRRFQKSTGILYELQVSDAAACELPEDCAATVFDVYSEALSSVARHTHASRIAIALTITPREVTMLVRDSATPVGTAVSVSLPVRRFAR